YTTDGANNPWPQFEGRAFIKDKITNDGLVIGPTVPEVMLSKAEALARQGNASEAMNVVNALRKNRFMPAEYVPFTASTPADALNKVIEERRRELCGTGLRWFDQKRLNKEAAFATTVTRRFDGADYTLLPNSNRYVYPIAKKYILLNPEIEQNPK
ncbi:MAG: RagB/SusD family nutrient uptake outer membrane protein, partial [Chitinophagaceae bacterium]|nr:RagB/SusD family nutrient uptake outer membrane protein [Chitinophagaceae bacterium]